jgi:hypothetical protein
MVILCPLVPTIGKPPREHQATALWREEKSQWGGRGLQSLLQRLIFLVLAGYRRRYSSLGAIGARRLRYVTENFDTPSSEALDGSSGVCPSSERLLFVDDDDGDVGSNRVYWLQIQRRIRWSLFVLGDELDSGVAEAVGADVNRYRWICAVD